MWRREKLEEYQETVETFLAGNDWYPATPGDEGLILQDIYNHYWVYCPSIELLSFAGEMYASGPSC